MRMRNDSENLESKRATPKKETSKAYVLRDLQAHNQTSQNLIININYMYTITAPLFVMLPRKTKADKKAIINLNNYRNWHYIVNNDIKKKYKEALWDQLGQTKLHFNNKIKIHFRLHQKTNRRIDRANVLSIHEKFFCDALTFYGCIPDDNDEYIIETKYTSGRVDKHNPRVDIFIQEINA